eukprot:gene8244-10132_t
MTKQQQKKSIPKQQPHQQQQQQQQQQKDEQHQSSSTFICKASSSSSSLSLSSNFDFGTTTKISSSISSTTSSSSLSTTTTSINQNVNKNNKNKNNNNNNNNNNDWFAQPEDWQINLKYLSKWKWRTEMNQYFHRYRKTRSTIPKEFIDNSNINNNNPPIPLIQESIEIDFNLNPLLLDTIQNKLKQLIHIVPCKNDIEINDDNNSNTQDQVKEYLYGTNETPKKDEFLDLQDKNINEKIQKIHDSNREKIVKLEKEFNDKLAVEYKKRSDLISKDKGLENFWSQVITHAMIDNFDTNDQFVVDLITNLEIESSYNGTDEMKKKIIFYFKDNSIFSNKSIFKELTFKDGETKSTHSTVKWLNNNNKQQQQQQQQQGKKKGNKRTKDDLDQDSDDSLKCDSFLLRWLQSNEDSEDQTVFESNEHLTGEINLLSNYNLYKTLNEFNSKHLSSTYKSYVKNLPGDNYIKREKHKTSSSGVQQLQQQPLQQQQSIIPTTTTTTTTNKLGGLTKLVEGDYPDENQQELILLPLDKSQLTSAFTLQDGGYIRPDKDKKSHSSKKHKKKRKHRDGSSSSSSTTENIGGTDEHLKKKKKKKDKSSIIENNITVSH